MLLPGAAGQPVAGSQAGGAVLQGARQDQGQFQAAVAMDGHAPSAGHVGEVQGGAGGGIHEDPGHLGPAQAPLKKLQGWYRHHLLVLSGNTRVLHDALAAVRAAIKIDKEVESTIDIDPMGMM